ncbi:MAG: serine/threonine protein kinase [Myxococcales bacterium]|nr:serine/threonine protein kinase [Myxococcales bacterium]
MEKVSSLADMSVLTTLGTAEAMQTLEERWQGLGVTLDGVHANEKGTLFSPPISTDMHWVEALPALSLSEDEEDVPLKPSDADLVVGDTLGEGGMGIVQMALQVPLHRQVAIKRLRKEKKGRSETLSLLREAWVTGMLEHPNIVPVYTLGRDPAEKPVFVMKRISGVPWQDVMFDAEHPLRKQDGRSSLLWNLDVLMQVCRAVHFAHNKGIMHRDLKPSNVMVGEYGEVYVVDWGIALALEPHASLPLPTAVDVVKLEGTPAYMAPEMAAVVSSHIGVRTDVYLLGALLHEILTGGPPHSGTSLLAVLADALLSSPQTYPEHVPEALVVLCRKAMYADPKERFESAEAFRRAISDFLLQRDSIELTERSQHELEELQASVGQDAGQTDLRDLFYRLGELRVGFHQALLLWSENQAAQAGLRQCLVLTCKVMIADEYLESAERMFQEIDSPPEELRLALEDLRARKSLEQKRRQRLEMDMDRTIGRRTRRFSVTLMMLFLIPYFLSFGKLCSYFTYSFSIYVKQSIGETIFFIAFGIWARETMMKNAINRRVLVSIGMMNLMTWSWLLYVWWHKIPLEQVLTVHILLQSSVFGMLALLTELALLWSFLVGCLCFLGAGFWPSWVFEWIALSLGLGLAQAAFLWKPNEIHPRVQEFMERWSQHFSR